MKEDIRLTIITVVYNDLKRFIPTFENICREISCSKYESSVEYLIKDGRSTDGLKKYIERKELELKNFKFISKEDRGIYSAMNQAVQCASGDYVLFINCGDKLREGSIRSIYNRLSEELKILVFRYEKSGVVFDTDNFDGLFIHRSPCHQAIVTERSITKFSENYDLASDYKFFLEKKMLISRFPEVISIFNDERKSSDYNLKIIDEKINILLDSSEMFISKYSTVLYLFLLRKWISIKNKIF